MCSSGWRLLDTRRIACSPTRSRPKFNGTTRYRQLAYRLDDVKAPGADPLFYFFSHNFQSPGVSSLPFSRFLVQGFLANARTGMQKFDASVRRRFGDLAVDELVALSPSLMLGGTERLVNVAKLPAVTAMIANGDIWTETRKGDVSEVEHYVDEKGRGRIRLHFAADL